MCSRPDLRSHLAWAAIPSAMEPSCVVADDDDAHGPMESHRQGPGWVLPMGSGEYGERHLLYAEVRRRAPMWRRGMTPQKGRQFPKRPLLGVRRAMNILAGGCAYLLGPANAGLVLFRSLACLIRKCQLCLGSLKHFNYCWRK